MIEQNKVEFYKQYKSITLPKGTSFPTVGTKEKKGMGSMRKNRVTYKNTDQNKPIIIVFVIGGITYSEI
jgi:hypothetical protein